MLMGRKNRKTEGRTKQTLNAPLSFYGGGIIILQKYYLADAFSLVENTHSKEKLKAMVREATTKIQKRNS